MKGGTTRRAVSDAVRDTGGTPQGAGGRHGNGLPPRAKTKIKTLVRKPKVTPLPDPTTMVEPLNSTALIQATEAERKVSTFQERIVAKAQETLEAAARAPELVEVETLPPGWSSKREFVIATHALQTKRNAPVYLDLAARTIDSDARLKSGNPAPAVLNMLVVNYQQGAPPEKQMPVIEVQDEKHD